MNLGPTLKAKSEVVASLQDTAKNALERHGPCEVPLRSGVLRITDLGNGAIGIEGVSSRNNPRFSLSVKDGAVTYAPPTHRDDIRREHGSERAFLSTLDSLIRNGLDRNSIAQLSYPKDADPSQGELKNRPSSPSPAVSLKEEIAQAWNTINRILTTPDGGQIDKSVTGIDVNHGRPTFNLHIRRLKAPDTIELEMISMSHRRDVFFDDRIIVKPDSIVYNLADSSEPFRDERYALDQLANWLKSLQASSSSS
jgi:hypothetical protein